MNKTASLNIGLNSLSSVFDQSKRPTQILFRKSLNFRRYVYTSPLLGRGLRSTGRPVFRNLSSPWQQTPPHQARRLKDCSKMT